MKRLIVLALGATGSLAGCTPDAPASDPLLSARISTLWNVGKRLEFANDQLLAEMEGKAQRRETAFKAQVFQPRQKHVDSLCRSVADSVRSLQNKIYTINEINALSGKGWMELPAGKQLNRADLLKLRAWLTGLDSTLRRNDELVRQELPVIDFISGGRRAPSRNADDPAWIMGASPGEGFLNLQQIRVNIQQHQNLLLSLFNEQICCLDCGDYYSAYSAIVGQNAQVLLAGQRLEISAGMGAFSRAAKPEVSIAGKVVEMGGDGQASTSFAVGGKPGTYHVPVRITFTDQDGKKLSITKDVSYRVVDTLCK